MHGTASEDLADNSRAHPVSGFLSIKWSFAWAIVWGGGAIALLCRGVSRAMLLRCLLRQAKPMRDRLWWEDFRREEERRSEARLEVRLLMHPEIRAPFAAGWLVRCIVIPACAVTWPAEKRQTVLCHEFEHVHNHDIAWQWLAEIIGALFWPNPLAWLARRRLVLTQEMAVDDAVLANGISNLDYATLLIGTARDGSSLPNHLTMVPMARASNLGLRVQRLLDSDQRRGNGGIVSQVCVPAAAIGLAWTLGITAFQAAAKPETAAAVTEGGQPAEFDITNNFPSSPPRSLVMFWDAVQQQQKKVIAEQKRVAELLQKLKIVDNDPKNPVGVLTMPPIAPDKQRVHEYVDIKTRYLEDKNVLESLLAQYRVELNKYQSEHSGPTAKPKTEEGKPAAVPDSSKSPR